MRNWASVFRSRRMAAVFLLGFSSGLPLLLVGNTLGQWLIDAKFDDKTIAGISAFGLPYTFKWAWAPLLDRYDMPFLGRRRGWILTFQLALIFGLLAMGWLGPESDFQTFVALTVGVATASASQDIVIDAYNTDVLGPDERAAGSAAYVMGYRTAMLVAGMFALVLADHVEWLVVYWIMAGLMVVGIVGVVLAEPLTAAVATPRTIAESVYLPFRTFFQRYGRHALVLLAFAATYKFGEQFLQVMLAKFYRTIGFSKTEIGVLSKFVTFAAFAVGGGLGGALVARYGLRRMLVVFGILQATTNLAYIAMAYAGHDLVMFGGAVFIENLSAATATAAFSAALMSFCSPATSATQMALLTSLSSVGQRVFGFSAGIVVEHYGYVPLFLVAIALAVPGIALAYAAMGGRKSMDT